MKTQAHVISSKVTTHGNYKNITKATRLHRKTYSIGTASDDIKAHLRRIARLQLHLNAIQLSLEPLLGARIEHLASHPRGVGRPCDEKDLALLAVLFGDEIKVVDRVPAFVSGNAGSEIIIAHGGLTNLLNNNLLQLLVDLEDYESMSSLRLQLQEFELAVIIHSHPRRCVGHFSS